MPQVLSRPNMVSLAVLLASLTLASDNYSNISVVAGPRQSSTIGSAGFDRSKTTADDNAVGQDALMLNNNAGRNQIQPLDRSAHEKSGLQRPPPPNAHDASNWYGK